MWISTVVGVHVNRSYILFIIFMWYVIKPPLVVVLGIAKTMVIYKDILYKMLLKILIWQLCDESFQYKLAFL